MVKQGLAAIAFAWGAAAHAGKQNRTVSGLDPDRIICPVMAMLYNSGDMRTDDAGVVEYRDMKHALMDGTWNADTVAEFQALGITPYALDHKVDQTYRDRCVPGWTTSGASCSAGRLAGLTGENEKRYVNIFKMNGLENIEHGFSTGTRGGNCNSPKANDLCPDGVYPCEALFQKYYVGNADAQGRLYRENILQIVCMAMAEGDRSGEFSYNPGGPQPIAGFGLKVPGRSWQMKAAMLSLLAAFGRRDEKNRLYIPIEDARKMLMEGLLPDGWKKRQWGCMIMGCPNSDDLPFVKNVAAELPCDEDKAWWNEINGNDCQTTTGVSCKLFCDEPGATCISGRCTCGKSNGRQTCYKEGRCVEQSDSPRLYFGEQCHSVPANNPGAPLMTDAAATVV